MSISQPSPCPVVVVGMDSPFNANGLIPGSSSRSHPITSPPPRPTAVASGSQPRSSVNGGGTGGGGVAMGLKDRVMSEAPLTAGTCASIVECLLCYRQANGKDSEKFVKCALEGLVKKLKVPEKRQDLSNLISAITKRGAEPSNCITIRRAVDGRLQVDGKKGFPHVIFTRIWRWPEVQKKELMHLEECLFAYDISLEKRNDFVCINPYHYERLVSSEIDIDQLTLLPSTKNAKQINANSSSDSANSNGLGAGSGSSRVPSSSSGPATSQTVQHHDPSVVSVEDQMQSLVISIPSTTVGEAPKLVDLGSIENPVALPLHPQEQPKEFWCSIAYFENDIQIGDLFKVPASLPTVTIDGYSKPSKWGNRFCLGSLAYIHRTPDSNRVRMHICEGVQLDLMENGDVWLTCLIKKQSVYVQSYYLDMKYGLPPGTGCHKIYSTAKVKVFDLQSAHQKIKEEVEIAQAAARAHAAAVAGRHVPAPVPEGAEADEELELGNADGIGIDELRRQCMLRLSFVKGWGQDYPRRQKIEETPCWIEIHLHPALRMLDEVLQSTALG